MPPVIRRDFLVAVQKGLHDVPYVTIGGSALAEHRSTRKTGGVDVLVGDGCSKRSAESLLIKRTEGQLVRLGRGKDGNAYPLDLSEDHGVDLKSKNSRDRISAKSPSGVKLKNFVFLLNSKAHAWQTRVPFEEKFEEKRRDDTVDIVFCLKQLRGRRDIDRAELPWIYTNAFWNQFIQENPQARQLLIAARFWTDETPGTPAGQDSNLSQAGWGSAQGSRAGSTRIPNSRQGSVDSYGSQHIESRWAAPGRFDGYSGIQGGRGSFVSGFAHGSAHGSMVSVRG
ncbi:hypothetical protein PspLS_09907 [Pyricularia sp. CBS 133598]|nr:hypothetical protein PspLS_09907 [Pyricularia sp. CBS 133598]